ncbi:GNAT family N-acetyltransferase [Natrarchaeobius chitinivorans]|uniref:GNAT family N-acetyltransferase n=1 Tax=Natrarchaeobius chitinivorans TaxID=1679083 RepID=A0A3N6MAA9_NATCH|nr:GNAT family N-acetyltransferase [Natrarchaeobius chitinivorans]RQG90516.1 GNAT family N-acetyltransferase [Natrarchaeobius chitinivorans]
MSADPTIKPATPAELDAITELWVRLARDQRSSDSHVRAGENRATMRETLAAHQASDGLLVARLDGDLAGFASFSVERGVLELDSKRGVLSNLYVCPAYRDRGVGSALLEAVEVSLANRGVDVVLLEVMAGNVDARRFYRRSGYEAFRVTMARPLGNQSENDTHSKEDR